MTTIPDPLTPDTLQAALGDRPFRYFPTVNSTQDLARAWAVEDPPAPAGAVVVTEYQATGRGRQGRAWVSPPGKSIMFSVILRPQVQPEHIPLLTIAAGVAVAESLAPLVSAVTLKWPNDVLLAGRKVCGILSEATWSGPDLVAVATGIGLNVRTDFTNSGLEAVATSLEHVTGQSIDRRTLLASLLEHLDRQAGEVGSAALLDAYSNWLGTLGQRVTVTANPAGTQPDRFSGVAEAVSADGGLIVRLDSGEQRHILAADVSLSEGQSE